MKKQSQWLTFVTVLALFALGCEKSTDPVKVPQSGQNEIPSLGKFPLTTYSPVTPSQLVACNLVDNAIARIPHGDGISPVTNAEIGPGGWRFNNVPGASFVTFAHTLNDNGTPADPSDDFYDVVAGRSAISGNGAIINDYPAVLDLPQATLSGAMVFSGNRGEIILSGGPGFELPGEGFGQVRINVHDPDGDGTFEGCAKIPFVVRPFLVTQGGDFLEEEYFKAHAVVDASGTVTFFEWTEISTFKNTSSGN